MRFGFEPQFKAATADTVEFTDPWGMDLHLVLYRDGSPTLARRLHQVNVRNPITRRLNNVMGRGSLAALSGGRFDHDALKELLNKEIDRLDFTNEESEALLLQETLGVAARIKSWSGKGVVDAETKKPIECSEEAKLELLQHPLELPDGVPFAGWTVGEALKRLIRDASAGLEVFRQEYLDELGKGSGSTSGGSSEPGPTIPTSETA